MIDDYPPTETTTLGAERDRLDARLDDLADETAATETPQADASAVEQQYYALEALVEEYGADAEVSFQGLTAGDSARVAGYFETEFVGDPGSELRQLYRAAACLQSAPWLTDEQASDWQARAQALADAPLGVRDWLLERTNAVTALDGDAGNGYAARVRARLDASDTATGSDTS